jgi:hypothetical protein
MVVLVKMIDGEDLHLNMDSIPWYRPDIPHIHKVLHMSNVRDGESAQKNPYPF